MEGDTVPENPDLHFPPWSARDSLQSLSLRVHPVIEVK